MKPGNVLVDASEHCYLCDFGLTKQLADGGTTGSGLLAGSLDTWRPSRSAVARSTGARTEYALGCVLYECLSGAPPFDARPRRRRSGLTCRKNPPHSLPTPSSTRYSPAHSPRTRRSGTRPALPSSRTPAPRSDWVLARGGQESTPAGRAPARAGGRSPDRRRGRCRGLRSDARVRGGIVAPPNSVAVIDPVSRTVVAAIPVGAAPTTITASDDWVWVINSNDGAGTISRIDPSSRRVVTTFSVPGGPADLLAAAGASGSGRPRLASSASIPLPTSRRSWTLPNPGKTSPFAFDPGAGFLAYGAKTIWAASFRAISRIDPATTGSSRVEARLGSARLRIRLGLDCRLVPRARSARPGHVATEGEGPAVVRVARPRDRGAACGCPTTRDTRSGRSTPSKTSWRTLRGRRPNRRGRRRRRCRLGAERRRLGHPIDPATGDTERIDVGGAPTGIAVGAGLVWVGVG